MSANLAELLSAAAARSADEVALVEAGSGRSMTFAELDEAATRVAAGLTGLGVVAGNRVLLSLPNRLEFVPLYFGVLRARLVAVPVNPEAGTGELVRMVADSGARLVVADAGSLTSARAAVAGLREALDSAEEELRSRTVVPGVVGVDAPALPGESTYEQITAEPPENGVLPPSTDAEALAALLYTSGTSGRPRAAMLSHRALLANLEQVARVEPAMVTAADVVLAVLPLFHVYGLNAVLGQALRHAARVVLVDGFDPEGSLEVIRRHGVTVVPVAPAALAHWRGVDDLGARLGGVRLLLSGSAPLDPDLLAEISSRGAVPVHQGYGLTEAAPVVTSTLCSATPKRGSVGAALPGVEVRLVDEAGRPATEDDPGEIVVAGANLFSGYWPDGDDGPVDGWFATGDVGFLDDDGDLFLVDRLTELVVVSGFNVYPVEVEEAIAEVAGVAEAAVVGVPDPETGAAVVAYVRRGPGTAASDEELAEAVRDHCARALARFKQPREIHVVADLPRTATGKVAKGRVRSQLRRSRLGLLE